MASAESACPCGFVGENCTQFGYVDDSDQVVFLAELESHPNGTCPGETQSYGCYYDEEEKEAGCSCVWGFRGDLCETKITVDIVALIVGGFAFPIGLSILLWIV